MPIPDFESAMFPILKLAGDGKEHALAEAMEAVAAEFGTTHREREELLPSGRQSTFYNRVGWAKTYLLKGGLLERTGRARFRITARGQEELRAKPGRVDASRMLGIANQSQDSAVATELPSTQTPEELLEESYRVLRKRLADELLLELAQRSPRFFERLVVDLLVGMGYGGSREDAAELVGKSGDEGIDGLIKEDRLGLDVVYVQAKRWKATVGRPIVQAFAGSLEGQRARKGVLITTSDFSDEADEYVRRIEKKIVLIDGARLADLMIEHNVGVATETSYTVKRMDRDYFDDEE